MVTAGSMKWVLGFVYESDDVTPIGAGDPKYTPGIILGANVKDIPARQVETEPYWNANSALPAGNLIGKKAIAGGEMSLDSIVTDGTGPYMALGTGYTSGTGYIAQFSPNGDVTPTCWHVENNLLLNEQAKEYTGCKVDQAMFKGIAVKTETGSDALLLGLEMHMVPQRVKDMTSDSVVRSTYVPIQRGSVSPVQGYNLRGNTGVTLTWAGLSFATQLVDFQSKWKNNVGYVGLQDNNDYLSFSVNGGKHVPERPTFKFLQSMSAAGDLDDLGQHVNGTLKGSLALTIPRRSSNDKAQIRWENVYLVEYKTEPAPDEKPGDKYVFLTFSVPTDIIFVEYPYTSAGVAAPNAAADYESA